MEALSLSLAIVFIAELGDKTQLVALCLASRFRTRVVLSGIFVATLAVHLFSVAVGGSVGRILSENWVSLLAGLAFIGFGFWTLHGDRLGDDECRKIQGRSPFWLVTITFFLAELGDKTMLSTVTLAAKHAVLFVWIGSTLGMVLSDGMAILAGRILGAKLPERVVRIGAAAIFFGFGIYSVAAGGVHLPLAAWLLAAAVVGALLFFFIRRSRRGETADVQTQEELVGQDVQP